MCATRRAVVVCVLTLLFSDLLQFATLVRVKREFINESVHDYLMKYGYLNHNMVGAGALRTEESVREAVKELQRFGNLPVTGELDEYTVKLMRTPRCGLPDVLPDERGAPRRKRFALQGQRWPYTNLTWSVRKHNLANLNSYEVRTVFSKALDVWARHSKLTFAEVFNDQADILISFYRGDHGDNYPFDGKGQILAHAFFPGSGRGGDAHFDEDEVWWTKENETSEEGTSLFHVAAHEFGHSLGLQHTTVDGALMYPWYQRMQSSFDYDLPDDDREGIQQLYGAHVDKQWERIPKHHPIYTIPTTTTTTTTTTQRPRHHDRNRHYHSHKPYKPRKSPMYPKTPGKYPYYSPIITTTTTTTTTPQPTTQHHHRHSPTKDGFKKTPPSTCNTSYDAVAVIRREVFIFKDAYFWRIADSGLLRGYPVEITRMWTGLPHNFSHVDAVYERPDNKIVFFIGRLIYVFTGNTLESGYPRSLTSLGLPADLERIDGATVWGYNGKTFFFSANRYWRFDEELGRVELDYPRPMDMWTGVGPNIDAVFQWKDGKTYFFKGKGFWKFNDLRMRVETPEQMDSAPFWMGCSKNYKKLTLSSEETGRGGHKAPYVSYNTSSAWYPFSIIILLLLPFFTSCISYAPFNC